MDSVDCVGYVNRDGNLVGVRAIAGEPLARSVYDCFPAVGRLSQLQISVMRSTATLLVRRRMVSPIAIGRKEPLGLRRAMMEAPQTYGRTISGTSTRSRRLTTSERSRRSRSDEAGRMAAGAGDGEGAETRGARDRGRGPEPDVSMRSPDLRRE